jgi:thioredoxin-dependent adenylylsulfate APS reductase
MSSASVLRVHEIPSDIELKIQSGELESWSAEDLLRWGVERFAPRIALSASFGSPEGMVILDLMHRISPEKTRVFTIDTGRLPQETHSLIDRIRERYGLAVEVYFPEPARVESMVRFHGMNLFYESLAKRELCCAVRKVEPLRRALAGLDAWISGLRPAQSVTRRSVRAVEIDGAHGGRLKLNPLVGWSQSDVWSYVRSHALPVNALHARGYPTVGCAPCTRPVKEGEDERSGRWWWERAETRECGIHTGLEEDGSGI